MDEDLFTVYAWLQAGVSAIVSEVKEQEGILWSDDALVRPLVTESEWNAALRQGFPPASLPLLHWDLSLIRIWTPGQEN